MSKNLILVFGSLAVFVLLTGLYLLGVYNGLVASREAVNNQWAQVQTQYQRRYDLIPNLVESVKGVMKQEQEIFGDLAAARQQYSAAQSPADQVRAANQVEGALGRLLAIFENYPELKSAENVQTLMVQLEGTENRIAVERKRFNDAVKGYNLMIKQFPTKYFATWFGFAARDYFEPTPGAEAAPQIKL